MLPNSGHSQRSTGNRSVTSLLTVDSVQFVVHLRHLESTSLFFFVCGINPLRGFLDVYDASHKRSNKFAYQLRTILSYGRETDLELEILVVQRPNDGAAFGDSQGARHTQEYNA